MSLATLKERLQSVHDVRCIDTLPKNATHTFTLDLLAVKRTDLIDLSHIELPRRVKDAAIAHLAIREDGDRFVISMYAK